MLSLLSHTFGDPKVLLGISLGISISAIGHLAIDGKGAKATKWLLGLAIMIIIIVVELLR